MKIITNLNGQSTDSSGVPVLVGGVANTQSGKGFRRGQRTAKNGIYFESSTGGKAFISTADLWTLAEQHDPNLAEPKPT